MRAFRGAAAPLCPHWLACFLNAQPRKCRCAQQLWRTAAICDVLWDSGTPSCPNQLAGFLDAHPVSALNMQPSLRGHTS